MRKRTSDELFAWLQLVRFPNAFTVVADVLAGAMLARGTWLPWPLVTVFVFAAVAMYWSGMILNDVVDVEKDRLQNRGRPLVDGRISLNAARSVGYGLLLGGFVAIAWSSWYYGGGEVGGGAAASRGTYFASWWIGLLLGGAIWLYDSPVKATVIGPVLMGGCRILSLLLGISLGWWLSPPQAWNLPHFWMAAIGNGVYVMGITWAARREAEARQTWTLGLGWLICLVGVAMLASVSGFAPEKGMLRLSAHSGYPIAIGLIALPWARRAWHSWISPSPKTIQVAVKQAILSIIFFDAILVLQFGGPWPAVAVCGLIVPAMILGRYFKST